MFNDLNNNSQNQTSVDDIFAETDKSGADTSARGVNSAAVNPEIETHRVGLTSTGELAEESNNKNNKWLKISLIVVVCVIVILSAYLLYAKFFKTNPESTLVNNEKATISTGVNTGAKEEIGSFVSPTANEATNEVVPTPEPEVIPEIPGVNSPIGGTSTEPIAAPVVDESTVDETVNASMDSDNDGLSDVAERAAGTNINVIDTDNDNLSDYEEVKIYKTNPLNADTDGDTYIDGEEVKNGYNPNGAGKLSEVLPKK